MNFGNRFLCSGVPVGVAGQNFRVPLHEDVIYSPRVDREAHDVRTLRESLIDSGFDVRQQSVDVPRERAITFGYAVGETVKFTRHNLAAILPAENMSAGGRANINSKIVLHEYIHSSVADRVINF